MSTALGISGVTAVLQTMLNTLLNAEQMGSVSVTSVAPDLAQAAVASGNDYPLTVNLFLHQVTPNAAWRNVGYPSLGPDGTTRLKNPPLALDLHYLLTAYAAGNFQAEALLGCAIQMLHDTPTLPRGQIRAILNNLPATDPTNVLSPLLGSSGLAEQIEMIKITPATLGREEMAWLWTALKADYRPTFPFLVSVVLIQTPEPAVSAVPVLAPSISAQPSLLSPLPALAAASPPGGQPAACIGDVVTLSGTFLAGAASVTLSNSPQGIRKVITPLTPLGNGSYTFVVPAPAGPPFGPAPTDLVAGVYLATVQVASGTDTVSTNSVPLAIAPQIGSSWSPGTIASGSGVVVTVPCTPYLWPTQEVSLFIGGQGAPITLPAPPPAPAPTNSPTFTFPALQPTSKPVPVWLSVDGVDSPILNLTGPTPVFAPPMVQVT